MPVIRPNIPTLGQYYESIGKNAKTTRNFCLAEFIDNSIESYERSHKGSTNGLKIDIVLNIKKQTIGELTEQQSIEITDNAQGIDIKRLSEVITLFQGHDSHFVNSDVMKKGNYGIGFKFASFVLGTGFIVNSKYNYDREYCVPVLIDENNRCIKISECEFPWLKKFEYKIKTDSGTSIAIPYMKPDKFFTIDELNYLIEFLSYRYTNSIKKGCTITIRCDHFNFNIVVPENVIKFFNVYKIPHPTNRDVFLNITKQHKLLITKFMEEAQITNIFSKEIKDEKIKEIFGGDSMPWNKIFDTEGLMFEFEHKVDKDYNIRIKWGMLSHQYRNAKRFGGVNTYTFSNINGLITMTADRNINHPLRLLEEPDSGPVEILGRSPRGSMPKLVILADYSNVGEAAEAEVNKKSIEWSNIKKKKEFEKKIKLIKASADKYFSNTIQPIIDFIEGGFKCSNYSMNVDLTSQNEENDSTNKQQIITNNYQPQQQTNTLITENKDGLIEQDNKLMILKEKIIQEVTYTSNSDLLNKINQCIEDENNK